MKSLVHHGRPDRNSHLFWGLAILGLIDIDADSCGHEHNLDATPLLPMQLRPRHPAALTKGLTGDYWYRMKHSESQYGVCAMKRNVVFSAQGRTLANFSAEESLSGGGWGAQICVLLIFFCVFNIAFGCVFL